MKIFLSFFLAFFFIGCSVKQYDTNQIEDEKKYTLKYSKGIKFNERTKDVSLVEPLENRPTSGDFKLLYYEDRLLKMSFDISVVDKNKFEPLKPVKKITDFTAFGAKIGTEGLGESGNANPAVLAVPVITTVGGFIVGVVTAIPEAMNELKDSIIVDNREVLNYYKVYSYNKNNTIKDIVRMD